MASRSSSSTHSPHTAMTKPSERSREELPSQGGRASGRSEVERRDRGPAEKKHKSLAEVQRTGRQSDQGDRPGPSSRRSSSRGSS
jgi:hypothetical protein